MAHRSPLEADPAGRGIARSGIALIAAGVLAVVGSCLTWRTVTTAPSGGAAVVLQRVRGLHFSRLGSANVGVGDLCLILGVVAILVGGVVLFRGGQRLLVAAVTICAVIVVAVTAYESTTIIRGSDVANFSDRAGPGLWLSLVAGILLVVTGVADLITARRGH